LRKVLVAGGSGFLGSHIVHKLIEAGMQVVLPVRRRDRAKHLALLPGVELCEGSLLDAGFTKKAMRGCTDVINLVGVLHGRAGEPAVYGPDFAKAHVELPKLLADIAVELGIRRYLHVSALGVTADGKRNLPSRYLRSKAAGEQSLRSVMGLDLTIFRPSVVFGREDKFLNLFASLQTLAPMMTLPRADARFQPVWVEDVAAAAVACLNQSSSIGQTYDLVGPKVYTLREIVKLAGTLSGHSRPVFGLPDPLGWLQTLAIEFAPGPTLMSRDNFDSMAVDNTSKQVWPRQVFGFEPSSLELIAPTYLSPAGSDPFDPLRARARR
jgi:uncharacterized protein YbjT (DUF2867 family)